MYGEDDLLALSGLQHLAFCERQWALIHVEQAWRDNADTLRGEFFHERVDTRGYSSVRGVRAERRVRLVSRELGIYGVADIVEYGGGDPSSILPVEYKVGRPKVEDWDRLQLTAQAMCLEEATGESVQTGALFYGETRRRESVSINAELRDRVTRLSIRIHELFDSGLTPVPACGSKCRRCSLSDVCLPELGGKRVLNYWARFNETLRVAED